MIILHLHGLFNIYWLSFHWAQVSYLSLFLSIRIECQHHRVSRIWFNWLWLYA